MLLYENSCHPGALLTKDFIFFNTSYNIRITKANELLNIPFLNENLPLVYFFSATTGVL